MDTISGMRFRMLTGVLAILIACASVKGYTQDTIRITLQNAEQEFTDKNLLLLAEKYNIDAARAEVVQARLLNNPNLSVTGNIYNPRDRKIADISNRTGEYVIEIQQVIRLAGKRNKEIRLAEAGIVSSEDRFFDLLRTLRYTLRSDFFRAYYINESIASLDRQITVLESLDTAYSKLQQSAVVTQKDALRIRSLLYSVRANKAALLNDLNDVVSELKLLLRNNSSFIIPDVDENAVTDIRPQDLSLQSLIDTAFAHRYDLRLSQSLVEYNNRNYALQKSYAVPDLTVGGQFDKRGSFVDNASFLNLAIDLPFFKKNQGNIKAAGIGLAQSKLQYQQQKLVVENEVQRAFVKLITTEKLYASADPGFIGQYEKLLQGIGENFQRRNISLLEFTDFYESYKNNIQQFNQLRNDRIQALEELYFSIGKTLLNY